MHRTLFVQTEWKPWGGNEPKEVPVIIETFIRKKAERSIESIYSLSVGSEVYFYIDSQGLLLYGFSQQSKPLSLQFTYYHKGENHYER